MKKIRILLAGNPNVGKTTLFNALCGVHQHTGNYPGVTVDVKEGICEHNGYTIQVSDLPGTYSLSAFTPDEQVARDALLTTEPDLILQIVDATSIERNLFLTTQLLEIGTPVVIALNMSDLADQGGTAIDRESLERSLGIPVVRIVALTREGIPELCDTIVRTAERKERTRPMQIPYPHHVLSHIGEITTFLEGQTRHLGNLSPSYAAIRLLEGDERLIETLHGAGLKIPVIDTHEPGDIDGFIEDMMSARYKAAGEVTSCAVRCSISKVQPSDLVDRVLTHRWLGIPIFLAFMWFAFQLTFSVSEPFAALLEMFFGWIGDGVSGLELDPLLTSFLNDGIVGGVGSVFSFVPSIFILFFLLALLEDSGYLARAAFVMDRLMHSMGMHGRSFIPLLVGFGCNVPAIMATRTLQGKADRIITIITIPFMSCAARLPVYVLFAGAFFGAAAGTVIFGLYFLGILVAVITALLFRRFVFHGEPSPFIMELPPYRHPTLFAGLMHMWYRGRSYLEKAGTIIVAGVILVWALGTLPFGVEYGSAESFAGIIGQTLQPFFEPLNFTWQLVVGLFFGFVAKEVVVGSLGALYGGEEFLSEALVADPAIGPVTALAYMVFVLLYFPCVAALAVIKSETGSWKWTTIAVTYGFVVAWLAAFLVTLIGPFFMGGFS